MSLFDALNAAAGGLTAQAAALSNISDNVANSQTVGFKATDTTFTDYLTQSSAVSHTPGAVVATPQYTNSVEGTVTAVSDPTAMAISGGGFFAVQAMSGTSSVVSQQSYTRAGDFAPNASGYLVNSDNYALDGWPVTNGVTDTSATSPIQISTAPSAPVATANVAISANLPSTPPTGTTSYTTTEQIYDATGTAQSLNLTWAQVPTTAGQAISSTNPAIANEWDLTVSAAGSTTSATGPILVTFGNSTASGAGTITAMTDTTGATGTVPTTQASGSPASVAVGLNFGSGTQNVSLSLGNFGSSTGVTQYSGSTYAVSAHSQDGAPPGNYSSVTIASNGTVSINYDNGESTTVAQVPLVNFANANALQEQTGQAYTATLSSGAPTVATAGTLGTGTLIVGSEEGSNVDIATEFTQMIVAQQAYTANSKLITIANSMMQTTTNMVQA